jgi:hypothetical protein
MIRNLSQTTIEKMRAKRLAEYERLNCVVLSALRRLGGSFQAESWCFVRNYLKAYVRHRSRKL